MGCTTSDLKHYKTHLDVFPAVSLFRSDVDLEIDSAEHVKRTPSV